MHAIARGSIFVLFGGILFGIPFVANAATLRITPSGTSVNAGSVVSVSVQVTSADKAMNAASGTVQFPTDSLQVVSVSKTPSIIGLWAQEPTFSNSAGTVNFEGVVLNPGFTGSNGTILTITLRALTAGSANLSIIGGSVLANDGNGTEILTGTSGATITIGEARQQEQEVVSTKGERLTITSPTHPNQEKAYRAEVARFEWTLPKGADAVRVLYDKKPGSTPTVVYDPPISYKDVSPGNGTWYFHAQARVNGTWGPVTHFKFTIDPDAPIEATTAPSALLDVSVAPAPAESKTYQWPNFLTTGLWIALIVLLLFLTFVWYALNHTRTRRHHGRERAHEVIHQEFEDLKEALADEIASLERMKSKRDLTTEEERILARFSKMLSKAELTIEKEIDLSDS